jgi:glucan phosphoethanolaminetransferase (alkaline phosphatase superfamily)
MSRNLLKASLLALWLWLPSLAVLATDHLQTAADTLALLCFSAFVLAWPFVLIPRPRYAFLLLTPLALLAGPYCFLTFFYHSVPGDALLMSAWQTSWAQTREVLVSFGWLVWLVPATTLAYSALAWSLPHGWRLAWAGRQRVLAGLLMFAMMAFCARTFLSHAVRVPPFFDYSTLSLAFPSNLMLSTSRVVQQAARRDDFASVAGSYQAGTSPLLVVLVIGESLRADHLGLNGYPRNTTPGLAAMGPELLSFRDAVSSANWTGRAVPTMVSIPVGDQRASIVQTFHEAGYRTAWFSNQEPDPISRMADVAEHATGTQDFHLRTDAMLLPLFGSFLRQAGPRQFVVLHTIGSHIYYDERYGADSRVFTPTLADRGVNMPRPQDKQAAINSYDNTVVETDKLLVRVIDMLRKEQRPAVMLFASDHGENLFDDERGLFMHTQSPPTRYDLRVPVLAWMNLAYRQRFPDRVAGLQANLGRPISHFNVFPTLLDLGSVAWRDADPRNSFAAGEFAAGKRKVYLNSDDMIDFDTVK